MNFFHLIILVISKMPGPEGAVAVPAIPVVVLTINYVFKIINIIWSGWSDGVQLRNIILPTKFEYWMSNMIYTVKIFIFYIVSSPIL